MKRARGFIAKGIRRTQHSWDKPGGSWPPKDQRDLYKLTVQDCKDMEQQIVGIPICFEHKKSVAQGYVTMSKFDLATGDWEVEFELGNKDGTENGATEHLVAMMKNPNRLPLGLSLSHMAVSQGKPRPNEISICFTPQRAGCYMTDFNGEQYTDRGYERGQVTAEENNLEVNASAKKMSEGKNFPPPNKSAAPDGMDTSADAPQKGKAAAADEWDAEKAKEAMLHFDGMKGDDKAKQVLLTIQKNARDAKKAAEQAAEEKKRADALAAKLAEMEKQRSESLDVSSMMASEWARNKQLNLEQSAKLRAYIAGAPPEVAAHMREVLVDASFGLQRQAAQAQQQQQATASQPSPLAMELMGYVGEQVQRNTAVPERHHARVFQSQAEIDEAVTLYNPFKDEIAVNASFQKMSKEDQAKFAPQLPPSFRRQDVDDFNAKRVHKAMENYRAVDPHLNAIWDPKKDAELYANMEWNKKNQQWAAMQGMEQAAGSKRRRVEGPGEAPSRGYAMGLI